MTVRRSFAVLVLLAVLLLALGVTGNESLHAQAQYPSRGINFIVPYAPGGGTDLVARILAAEAEKELGVNITVVNIPGAGAAAGMLEAATARPDGYTIVMVAPPVVTLRRLGLVDISYEDFDPVIGANFDPFAITVRTDAPWKDFHEFLRDVTERPFEITVGTTPPGGAWHTAALAFERATGAHLNIVPFEQGAIPAVIDLVGGHIDAVFVSVPEVAPQIDAGNLRLLAVGGEERHPAYPDVPTLAELGIDVPAIGAYRGILAPKGTPPEAIEVLHQAFRKAMDSEAFRDYMETNRLGVSYMAPKDWYEFLQFSDRVFVQLMNE